MRRRRVVTAGSSVSTSASSGSSGGLLHSNMPVELAVPTVALARLKSEPTYSRFPPCDTSSYSMTHSVKGSSATNVTSAPLVTPPSVEQNRTSLFAPFAISSWNDESLSEMEGPP